MSYQLELFDKSEQQIKDEIQYYFDYLQKPSDVFGGMPVCPFLKAELESNKLLVEIWKPNEFSFNEVWDKFNDSDFDSAIIICLDADGLDWRNVDRKSYQKLKGTSEKIFSIAALASSSEVAGSPAGTATPWRRINSLA